MVERHVTGADGAKELVTLELQAGSFFGEAALLADKQCRRNASIRAIELCHLYILRDVDFKDAINDFPEYKHILKVTLDAPLWNAVSV